MINPSALAFLNDTLLLTISEDRLEAWVAASFRKEPLAELTEEDVRAWLKARSVTFGLLDDVIVKVAAWLRGKPAALPKTLIASGKPPVRGRDGSVTFHFSTDLAAGRVEHDDRVDFYERGLINNVEEGALLAEVIPPELGVSGMTVLGKVIQPTAGRTAKLPRIGVGVKQSEDGMNFVAMLPGHATVVNERLEVHHEFSVEGDVDFKLGNIDFVGDLYIDGNVLAGFSVKADGHIIITGSIERNGQVEAAGNITVQGTIRSGRDRALVCAGESIICNDVENSFIKARNDVQVLGDLVTSQVMCGGRLLGESASIRGCEVEAVGGIDVLRVGSKGGAKNILTVGITLERARELKDLQAKIIDWQKTIDTIESVFNRKFADLTQSPEAIQRLSVAARKEFDAARETMGQRLVSINDRIEKATHRIIELVPEIEERDGMTIAVSREILPPCVINIRWEEWVVRNKMEHIIFYDNILGGRISTKSYVPGATDAPVEETLEDHAPDAAFAETVEVEMKARRMSAQELATKITMLAASHSPLGLIAMQIGLAAIQQKRYQTPEVFVSVGRSLMRTAEAQVDDVSREGLFGKAEKILTSVLAKDKFHAQCISTRALLMSFSGKPDEALQQHKMAIDIVNKLSTKGNAPQIYCRYGEALRAQAERMAEQHAGDGGTDLFAQAQAAFTTALKLGAQAAVKVRCEIALREIEL